MFLLSTNFLRLYWRFVLQFSSAFPGFMKKFMGRWISRRKAFPRDGSIAGRCRWDGLTGLKFSPIRHRSHGRGNWPTNWFIPRYVVAWADARKFSSPGGRHWDVNWRNGTRI